MRSAWEEFVSRYAQTVFDAALRVLGNAQDAEDVGQDVFLEIYENRRMIELVEQPALVRAIATRRAIDRLRRRKSAAQIDHCQLTCRESEPIENALAAELDQRLRDSIVLLSPREAEVFCLSVFEGVSTHDIAELLNTSPGAVNKSLCSARTKLSEKFGLTKPRANQ